MTKDYERAIKLIEASFAQLYGQEADEDEVQKKFIQLHQDCCLAYFMQLFEEAPDEDRINGWIDTYEIPDKTLLVRFSFALPVVNTHQKYFIRDDSVSHF